MSEKPMRLPTYGTLRDAGLKEGDFLPLYTFNPNYAQSVSFTSTSWDTDPNLSNIYVDYPKLFPSEAQPQVYGQVFLVVGTDETVDLRIHEYVAGETLASVTGLTSNQMVALGPVDYFNTGRRRLAWSWKESPGANSSKLYTPFICLGVKI